MEITPDKWQQAKALFDAVLQQAPADRATFLAKACPEDDLRAQVEELLRNHKQAGSFLSKPILDHRKQDPNEKSERFASGTIIASRFKIIRLLGKGGMGEVFEAEGYSHCTVTADTKSDPSTSAKRVWILCGEKSILLIRRSFGGKSYNSVWERLGEMKTEN